MKRTTTLLAALIGTILAGVPEAIAQDETPLVDTQDPAVGQNISEEQIKNLPVDSRNFQTLINTVPGVLTDQTPAQPTGQTGAGNQYMIDGIVITDLPAGSDPTSVNLETGTLSAAGQDTIRIRINRFGTYQNVISVTSQGVTRTVTRSITVGAAPGTCPVESPSSQRFKRGIVGLLPEGVTLSGLRPVAFRYTEPYGDPAVAQIGLIAEEVVRVYPEAVAIDAEGRPEGIYYGVLTGQVIARLETRASRELNAGVARLAKALE
ncbi:MAG: tail fiber domain-containing protein [Gemmatimonadota bacterium]